MKHRKMRAKKFKIKGATRLRNLAAGTLYSLEEADQKLSTFLQFKESGARITVEEGEFCSVQEVSVKICNYDSPQAEEKIFYFKQELNVGKCKQEICEEFGIDDDEVKNFFLYRFDSYGEPAWQCKDNKNFSKNNVISGDRLALRNNKNLTQDEKFKFLVHLTTTGLPDDCTYIGEIEESKESKLADLKETILGMRHFNGTDLPAECLRLREKTATQYFGKIFRDDGKKTLKQIGFKGSSSIVAQLLDAPEALDINSAVLLLCKRNVKE